MKTAMMKPVGCAGITRRAGMTMIELMVVIVVIAILFAILMPAIGRLRQRAHRADAQATMAVLQDAIMQYHFEYGRWPIDYGNLQPEMEFDDNNHEVIEFLMVDHDQNTKKIQFIQIDDYTTDAQGNIVNPWGDPYIILFDTDANTVSVSY